MSNLEIKAEIKSLKKILCDDEFFYQIPDYQRPYSWDKENLSDLIEDLVNAYENNKEENYFCGSLVLENKKEYRYGVIDGQQRLTTFTILFCVFRDFFIDKLEEKSKDYIALSIEDKYDKSNKKLKFLTSEGYQNKFQQTVIENIEIIKGEKDLKKIKEEKNSHNKYLQNAYLLKDFIEERIEEKIKDVNKFIEWIFEKVVLTQIICPNQDTAIQIFNVLNDRGMALSSVDILKSTLMQNLLKDEDRRIFKANWEKIKAKLEGEELNFENLFTIYLYYLKPTNPKITLHKELLGTFKSEDSLKLIYDLEKFSESYIEVRKLKNKYFYCLKYLRHSIYWQSILTTATFKKYKYVEELKKVLVAYYYQNWIAGATTARIKQTSFSILKLVKKNASINVIKEQIKKNLTKYETENAFKEELDSIYVYGKRWDKPLLLLLEYFSKDDSNVSFIPLDNKTWIEHILPQNPENGSWDDFSQDDKKNWTNALANLTLLSMRKNIQAQNFSFQNKKEIYLNKDNVATSFELTRQIFDNNKNWDIEVLKDRQKNLISKIEKILNIF